MTRREGLEKLRDGLAFSYGEDAHMMAVHFGFTACLDLLWPCLTALETCASIKGMNGFTGVKEARAIKALAALDERIKEKK